MLKFIAAYAFILLSFLTGLFADETNSPGSVIWTFKTDKPVTGSLAVVNDRLYFGGLSDNLYCLSSGTGEKYWDFNSGNTNSVFISSPFYAGENIYIGADQARTMYCVSSLNGSSVWGFSTEGGIESSPRVFGGRVYFGSSDNKLYCLDSEKGIKSWDFITKDAVRSSPLIISSRVYFGSVDGTFYCLDAGSGTINWTFQAGGPVNSSPAFSAGRVYFGTGAGKLFCLDCMTGNKLWEFSAQGGIISSPAVEDGKVFFGSLDGNFYCLNFMTGKQAWNFKTGGGIVSSPSISDGNVYFGSFDKKFYCLDEQAGTNLWELETSGQVRSSPAVNDGKIYFGNDAGTVYCIDSGSRDIDSGNTLGGQDYFIAETVLETNAPEAVGNADSMTNSPETDTNESGSSAAVLTVTNFITNYIMVTNTLQEQTSLAQPVHYKYTVQAGSFRTLKNAKKLYNFLRENGYNAFYSRIRAGKTWYYRVRVGKLNSIPSADYLMNKLRNEGYRPVLVKKIN
jgi:outer membrane protein assembly factor BamB